MTPAQILRVRESFEALGKEAGDVVERFYTRLLGENPAMRLLLPRDLREHTLRTVTALGILVRNADHLETLEPAMGELGASYLRRGAQPQHYGIVRETLLAELAEAMGEEWDETLRADWAELLNHVAGAMLRGAGRARGKAA